MKNISKYSKQIQKYLANELSESELSEFENLIKNHSDIQDEIQLYRKVSNAIADPSLENFKKELDQIHIQNFGSSISINTKQSKQWYLIAASLVILITLSSIFLFQDSEVNTSDVFAKYYHPLESNYSRSIDDKPDAFSLAMNDYNNKHYDFALSQFSEIVDIKSDHYAARLYLGVCGIEMGEYKIAENQFKMIIASKDAFYLQDAEWYLSLLYLKMKQLEKAKSALQSIYEKGGVFAQNALLVLDELE